MDIFEAIQALNNNKKRGVIQEGTRTLKEWSYDGNDFDIGTKIYGWGDTKSSPDYGVGEIVDTYKKDINGFRTYVVKYDESGQRAKYLSSEIEKMVERYRQYKTGELQRRERIKSLSQRGLSYNKLFNNFDSNSLMQVDRLIELFPTPQEKIEKQLFASDRYKPYIDAIQDACDNGHTNAVIDLPVVKLYFLPNEIKQELLDGQHLIWILHMIGMKTVPVKYVSNTFVEKLK